jgi:hypothetical protein
MGVGGAASGSSHHPLGWLIASGLCVALLPSSVHAQASDETAACDPSFYDGRIVTPEEVKQATVPKSSKPWWVIGWPCRKIYGGMESGLIKFEKGKFRAKVYDWQRRLAAAGFRPLFGGLGEGSGMGVGTIYDYPHRTTDALHLMGRVAFLSGYQEFSANFDQSPFEGTYLNAVVDYQWRPNEPFYGFGQDSSVDDASSFALRQGSFSLQWRQRLHGRIRVGAVYTLASLKALNSTGGTRPPVEETFGDLPGLDQRTNFHSIGANVGLSGYRGDYRLGGRGEFGASWQDSYGGPDIRYLRMEGFMEGRLPVVTGRSAFLGQAGTVMIREDSGTAALPFYLYARTGGSATLRGFPLDRFYGRNMILATLEYRWLIHPGIEAQIFYDSGQIFQHTNDISLLNWQRNYGFGLRFRNKTGTQFRLEFASSDEGFSWHITFGDRPIPILGGGPVRYPLYRP